MEEEKCLAKQRKLNVLPVAYIAMGRDPGWGGELILKKDDFCEGVHLSLFSNVLMAYYSKNYPCWICGFKSAPKT